MSGANGAAGNPQVGTPGAQQQNAGPANPQVGNGAGTGNPQVGTPGSGNPQQPQSQAAAAATQQPQQTPQSQLTYEQALDALSKERLANADARTKLKRLDELEAKAREAELAKLSETERLQRQASEYQARTQELEQRVQRQELSLAAYRLAGSMGITDIGAALALVQSEHGGEIAFDEKTQQPKNLEALLTQVIADHPILAAGASQQGQQSGLQQQQRAPVQSGGAMNPGRAGAPTQQQAPNRPLRTFNDVTWSR